MKIKAVCERTGLTDRTIRYYIEESLIMPNYSENYLGRKTFDFSEKDVSALHDIATLRKFDFSIDEIKTIMEDAQNSKDIIADVIARTTARISEKQAALQALSQLEAGKAYTLQELASRLSAAAEKSPVRNEAAKKSFWKTLASVLRSVALFTLTWLPLILCVVIQISNHRNSYYPVYSAKGILLTAVFLLPSVALFITKRTPKRPMKRIRCILTVLCILCLPANIFLPSCIVRGSETTNIQHYRDLDTKCYANTYPLYQDLFPARANYHTVVKQPDGTYKRADLDGKYYYRYIPYGGYYDIYAEWPLSEDDFYKEVDRAKKLFATYGVDNTLTKGRYTCLVFGGPDAFGDNSDGYYEYTIFAYDEEHFRVRYIHCFSLDLYFDKPYHQTLEW